MENVKHEHGWGSYFIVFNALIFLTIVTVGLSYLDVGGLMTSLFDLLHAKAPFFPSIEIGHGANIVLGLIVALIKASLVAWFFMHQRDEENLNRFALLFCIGLFLWVTLVFSMDFVFLKTYAFKELAGMALGTN